MPNPGIAPHIYSGILPVRQWLPVLSSNLQAVMFIPHDPRTNSPNQLFIRFLSNAIYVYYNVPRKVWLDLMKAPSKGRFHRRKIRSRYSYARLS